MYTAIALNRYGSLEIKRAYRKNMATGIIVAAMIMFINLSAYWYFANTTAQEYELAPPTPRDSIIIIDVPIPRIYDIPKPTQASIAKPIPSAGIPIPVPDDEADENNTVPTQTELDNMTKSHIPENWEEITYSAILVANPEEILPSRDTFIKFDEAPQTIESVAPIYPEMARISGVQGDVWIQAYIDKNGDVKAVEILKASGANAGFEESAIAAAKATSWTPAISNGQPVGVWVSYKIEFRLR